MHHDAGIPTRVGPGLLKIKHMSWTDGLKQLRNRGEDSGCSAQGSAHLGRKRKSASQPEKNGQGTEWTRYQDTFKLFLWNFLDACFFLFQLMLYTFVHWLVEWERVVESFLKYIIAYGIPMVCCWGWEGMFDSCLLELIFFRRREANNHY